ncbi:hypothetical protein EKK58_02410 [Candidatus Dependentiae bacterium]|nr:MAG: hypothetical protein EKK58_02410 [Candidatus Dependentiae bacterium]
MKKTFLFHCITIIFASTNMILAMEEDPIDTYRKYAEQEIINLIQDPNTITFNHEPTIEEQEDPANILYCDSNNNTWYNIYQPLQYKFENYKDPLGATTFFTKLCEGNSNILPLLNRGINLYFAYKNSIEKTLFARKIYYSLFPKVIGLILTGHDQFIPAQDSKEAKLVRQCGKIAFKLISLAPLHEQCAPQIIHFILALGSAATNNKESSTCNIIMPIQTLNLKNEYPFAKEDEIINFVNDQNAQKENYILKKCRKNGLLIFFLPAGDQISKKSSLTITQYTDPKKTKESEKSNCILQ